MPGVGDFTLVVAISPDLTAVGLSLPYPLYYDEAERVLPTGRSAASV